MEVAVEETSLHVYPALRSSSGKVGMLTVVKLKRRIVNSNTTSREVIQRFQTKLTPSGISIGNPAPLLEAPRVPATVYGAMRMSEVISNVIETETCHDYVDSHTVIQCKTVVELVQ